MNTTTMTKIHHKLVAVTEERDRLAAELAKMMEQKPVAEAFIEGGGVSLLYYKALLDLAETGANIPRMMLYAAAVPAVAAPAVLDMHKIEDQLLLAETEMLNAKAWAAGNQSRTHIGFAMTAISCARALLQSVEVRHD